MSRSFAHRTSGNCTRIQQVHRAIASPLRIRARRTSGRKKIRVLVVLGTRPEAIKLALVINELRRRPGIVSRVCVTGQHREMLDQVRASAIVETVRHY